MIVEGAADRQRELVRQAVDGMQRPLFVLDQGSRLRYVNPAAVLLFDRPSPDVLGLHVWQDLPRVAGTVLHRTYGSVAADGETRTAETFVARTGRWWRADVSRTDAGLVTLEDGEGVEDDGAVLAVRALPLPSVDATVQQGAGVREGPAGTGDGT